MGRDLGGVRRPAPAGQGHVLRLVELRRLAPRAGAGGRERHGTASAWSSEQSIYNLLTRSVELEVLPAARAYGIGVDPVVAAAWAACSAACCARRSEGGGARRAGPVGRPARASTATAIERTRRCCDELGEDPARRRARVAAAPGRRDRADHRPAHRSSSSTASLRALEIDAGRGGRSPGSTRSSPRPARTVEAGARGVRLVADRVEGPNPGGRPAARGARCAGSCGRPGRTRSAPARAPGPPPPAPRRRGGRGRARRRRLARIRRTRSRRSAGRGGSPRRGGSTRSSRPGRRRSVRAGRRPARSRSVVRRRSRPSGRETSASVRGRRPRVPACHPRRPGFRGSGARAPSHLNHRTGPSHLNHREGRQSSEVVSFSRRARRAGTRWELPVRSTYCWPKIASRPSSRRRTAPAGWR